MRRRVVTELKFVFTRFSQPVTSVTDGAKPYRAAADVGITNLPPGQASHEFPGASFATSSLFPTPEATCTSNGASGATQATLPNPFPLVANLQLSTALHATTLAIQMQSS